MDLCKRCEFSADSSGLPKRNGSMHASEIANMALDIHGACRNIQVTFIPGEKIYMRMGIHSGT